MFENKWSFKTIGSIQSGPIVNNNIVVFKEWGKYIYAIDILTGIEIWKFEATSIKFIAENGIVFTSGENDFFYAISIVSGEIIWKFKADSSLSCQPACDEVNVYFASSLGYIYCINISNGKLVKTFDIKKSITKIIISNELLFFSANGYIEDNTIHSAVTEDRYFIIFDLSRGTTLKTYINADPVVAKNDKDFVYFSTDKVLYAMNTKSKSIIWETHPNSTLYDGQLFINDNYIYFPSPNSIQSFNLFTGEQATFLQMVKTPTSILISNNLIFCMCSGMIEIYNLGTKMKIHTLKSNFTLDLHFSIFNNLFLYACENSFICIDTSKK